MQNASEQSRGRGIGSLDRGGGQQDLAHQRLAWRQFAQGRGPQVLLDGMVDRRRASATLASSRPRRAAGRSLASSAGERRSPSDRRSSASCSSARASSAGLARGARTWRAASTVASASRTCPRAAQICAAVQQRQELEERPALFGDREHLLGEMLRGIEVPALQREAGQRAQMVDGEEMLAESQPLRIGIGGPGRSAASARWPGSNQASARAPGTSTSLTEFGDVWCRQSRGCLALGRREVVQAGIHADEDQRDWRRSIRR